MKRCKQLDSTGCGLACIAMLSDRPYSEVKKFAGSTASGIVFYSARNFRTDANDLKKLANHFGINIPAKPQRQFKDWDQLPDCAILAIKYNEDNDTWHWVVFRRTSNSAYVIDPKPSIKTNHRTDFNRMKPRYFIPVDINAT